MWESTDGGDTAGGAAGTEAEVKPNAACQSVLDATGIVSGISAVGIASGKKKNKLYSTFRNKTFISWSRHVLLFLVRFH